MTVKRRRVAVGQTVEMVLSTDLEHKQPLVAKICGEVRRLRILDGCVELLRPNDFLFEGEDLDRPWISFKPPYEYVGIYKDRRGLWVKPTPRWLVQVERYGKPVSVPMLPGSFAVRWLETYTPWYAERCLRSEGYSINENYYYEARS
ncbi:hypothetical protein [Nocardia sp. NRRL S-836]|uniref:hypothetical protein n=1 Tax=Nocardia sp. NRRL S-836 TaxID=1519492 RepID=UPI0006AF9323|nr:hypothetical protein [Nocardia sp. NRRL S-836]KOV84791.1 hypothetical protein ADL03_16130 [Nocardia sp. NRRL S-836]